MHYSSLRGNVGAHDDAFQIPSTQAEQCASIGTGEGGGITRGGLTYVAVADGNLRGELGRAAGGARLLGHHGGRLLAHGSPNPSPRRSPSRATATRGGGARCYAAGAGEREQSRGDAPDGMVEGEVRVRRRREEEEVVERAGGREHLEAAARRRREGETRGWRRFE